MPNIYNQNLEKNSANYQPLTPITFLERAASGYPERVAVIYGKQEYNYSEFYSKSSDNDCFICFRLWMARLLWIRNRIYNLNTLGTFCDLHKFMLSIRFAWSY